LVFITRRSVFTEGYELHLQVQSRLFFDIVHPVLHR